MNKWYIRVLKSKLFKMKKAYQLLLVFTLVIFALTSQSCRKDDANINIAGPPPPRKVAAEQEQPVLQEQAEITSHEQSLTNEND